MRWKLTGRVWPSSPLSHKHPYSSQSFRVQLPLLSLLQCPLSQPPQSPLPHSMQLLSPWALCSFAPCCCTGWWALLWTSHRAKGGHVDKVHLQARCMKSMQAVRAKSVSPTSRGLRLPLSPSHAVKLLTSHKMMRKRERRRLSKRPPARSGWKSFTEWTGCMVLNQLHM